MYRLFAIACVATLCCTGPGRAAEPAKLKSALLEEGALQKARAPLQRIFAFTFDGPRLKLDRQSWDKVAKDAPKPEQPNPAGVGREDVGPPIETIFGQIQEVGGVSGFGMSVSGKQRQLDFSGEVICGRLFTNDTIIRMGIDEADKPGRTLELNVDDQDGFRLQITHPQGDMILMTQGAERFVIVAILGEETFTARDKSFVACYRKHRQEFDEGVLPVLAALGIQPVLSPATAGVRHAALAILARTPNDEATASKLLGELDSDDFTTRETATKLLGAGYILYRPLIDKRLKEKPSLETRNRLQRIIADNADMPRVEQALAALGLLDDPVFLVALFEQAKETGPLVARLEKVTGQKLGADRAAWKAWLDKNPR